MTTLASRRRFLQHVGFGLSGLSSMMPDMVRKTLAEERHPSVDQRSSKTTRSDGEACQETPSSPAMTSEKSGPARHVEYKQTGKKSLTMDIYPPSVQNAALAPVHVFIHGGGWLYNDRTRSRLPVFQAVFDLLGNAGFIGVSIDYTPASVEGNKTIPVCIENCKDAIRFIRSQADRFKADPRRIAVWGESAGGHLALMVALSGQGDFPGLKTLAAFPADVRCACSWYGPTDFTTKEYMTSTGNFDYNEKLLGGSYSEAGMAFYRSISPCHYLTKGGVPLLLCHGDKDEMTDWRFSAALDAKAREVGQDVTFLSVRNARHVWRAWQNMPIQPSLEEIQARTVDFLLKHVLGSRLG